MSSVRTALDHKHNTRASLPRQLAYLFWQQIGTPMFKSDTCTVPAIGDGVRYILVVTRQAVEKSVGRILNEPEFHA